MERVGKIVALRNQQWNQNQSLTQRINQQHLVKSILQHEPAENMAKQMLYAEAVKAAVVEQ